jgi:hypothetical protein
MAETRTSDRASWQPWGSEIVQDIETYIRTASLEYLQDMFNLYRHQIDALDDLAKKLLKDADTRSKS